MFLLYVAIFFHLLWLSIYILKFQFGNSKLVYLITDLFLKLSHENIPFYVFKNHVLHNIDNVRVFREPLNLYN